nr:MAG TPA: Receptor Binding Protein [Caudoviricetes sp.]
MAFSYGFFNAKNLDRVYTAEDFTSYLSSLICNGILDTYGGNFSVTAGGNLSVVIGTGKAWIGGHYFINDMAYTLDLRQYVDESLSRYVTIGISCDVSDSVRACKLEVKSGTAATSPSVPVFENTDTKTYLTLASVRLNGGITSISQSNIKDYRSDENKCGYVKCILGKCRVSEMLLKMEQIDTLLAAYNKQISDLQYTVDLLQTKVDDLTGDIIETGQCGEDIYYVLYSNGKLLLRGTGAMYDYDSDNRSPFRDNETIKTLVVSSGITHLGEDAFMDAVDLTSATLPDSLTSIADSAFMQSDDRIGYVHGLTNIVIPDKVTTLGGSVFWGTAITSITIPASVTAIGKYLCRDCLNLTEAHINGTLLGAFMFTGCTKLQTLTISSKVKSIGECAFTYCSSLESISFYGTTSQWSSITKGSNWDGLSGMDVSLSGLTKIQCTDGYFEYDNTSKTWNEVND